MQIRDKFTKTYDKMFRVGYWDSLSDAALYIGTVVFLISLVVNVFGYAIVCSMIKLPFFIWFWNMTSLQNSLFVFFLINIIVTTFVITLTIINLYDKIINKPVRSLQLQMRGMGNDERLQYLISGKLSRPFSAENSNETWLDMVQDYVDTASAEKYYDELTGCFNRKYFSQILVQFMKTHMLCHPVIPNSPKTYNSDVFGVFLIDIDHFKRINDDFGHASGDEVLRNVGSSLRMAVGDLGVVIRNGGEEFLIVAAAKFPYDFALLATKINNVFRENISVSSPVTGETRRITCSVGFVNYPLYEDKNFELSLQNHVDLADQAMYIAKMNGRDTWRELVALKTPPAGDTDVTKFCSDPDYGIGRGFVSVRDPGTTKTYPGRRN